MDTAGPTPRWQKVMRIIIAVSCVLALALGAAAFKFGALFNYAILLIMASCLLVPLARLPYLIKKEIHWSFWKAPFSAANRRYWRPILLRVIFWSLCGAIALLGIVAAQFQPEELSGIYLMIGLGAGFLCLLSLIPKRVGGKPMSIFSAFAISFMIFILGDSLFPQITGKDAIAVSSPFADESYMFHAGHNTMMNYHVAYTSQKHALDITTINENGAENNGDKTKLEDYACFGAPLIAPVAGQVVIAIDGYVDQEIGGSDRKNPAGNHVVIKMNDIHYAMLAHMKQGQTIVNVGDRVSIGQKLGECGNSGNTTGPHLHFQLQSEADPYAKGIHTYPVKFDNTARIRRGKRVEKDGLFYIRNDRMVPN